MKELITRRKFFSNKGHFIMRPCDKKITMSGVEILTGGVLFQNGLNKVNPFSFLSGLSELPQKGNSSALILNIVEKKKLWP